MKPAVIIPHIQGSFLVQGTSPLLITRIYNDTVLYYVQCFELEIEVPFHACWTLFGLLFCLVTHSISRSIETTAPDTYILHS